MPDDLLFLGLVKIIGGKFGKPQHLGVAGARLIKECLQARSEQRIFPGKDPENE
jgi:hypothetical protein